LEFSTEAASKFASEASLPGPAEKSAVQQYWYRNQTPKKSTTVAMRNRQTGHNRVQRFFKENKNMHTHGKPAKFAGMAIAKLARRR
jgi:hypothetical protein